MLLSLFSVGMFYMFYRAGEEAVYEKQYGDIYRFMNIARKETEQYSSLENYLAYEHHSEYATKEELEKYYNSISGNLNDYIIYQIINFSSFWMNSYNCTVLLKNKNSGEVNRLQSMIYYPCGEEEERSGVIELEKYLTENEKNELCSLLKSSDKHCFLNVSSLKTGVHNGETVPISFKVYSEDGKQSKDFVISSAAEKECIEEAVLFFQSDYSDGLFDENGECKKENGFFSVTLSSDTVIDGDEYLLTVALAKKKTTAVFKDSQFGIYFGWLLIMLLLTVQAVVFLIEKLYEKMRAFENAKAAFTSAAAHELKTPIAVIQNQSECIIENIMPQKNDEYIKSIHAEALRMSNIVNNLLEYNRIVNASDIKKERCDFCEIIREEAKKYETFALQNGAKISLKLPNRTAMIHCNRDLIATAVDNLLSNAVKYSSGERNIVITLDGRKNEYGFEIYNDGNGVPKELQNSIWEILSKADKARTSAGGSGMGLAICKEIFKFHNYTYGYRNNRDGVIFWFVAH